MPEPLGNMGSSRATLGSSPSDAGAHTGKRRWAVVACVVFLVGVGASITAALMWRASVRSHNSQSFQTAAADVSGTLETLLRRDTDYVRSVRTVLSLQPNQTAGGFERWLEQLEGRQDQPMGFGALIVRSVPAAELAAFQARRRTDPAFRALVGGQPESIAPSGRSHYCLLSGGSADLLYNHELAQLLEGDWCDPTSLIGGYQHGGTTRAGFTQALTDKDEYGVYSLTLSSVSSLIVEAPAYRPGVPLQTVPERRAAVLGWVLGSFDIPLLMRSSLAGNHHVAVTLYHVNQGLGPEFIGSMGRPSSDEFTHQAALHVDGTWIVKVTGAGVTGGLSAGAQALIVLLVGVMVSALLAALVLVLSRSRERALAMVEEKTGQLRHQALHDALTGLPNRMLALDRAEQVLARARRQQRPVAALYLDIDGFKDVNDTFGHAAGDELLRLVAGRLASVVRQGDSAARLGGDEFVIIVEGSTLDAGPELVAERLLEVLRQPYDMRGEIGRELSVTASVGIAFGLRASADELVRDADIALYEAKAAGRNGYVLFQSSMQTAAQDRLTTQMDLADALEQDQLFLLYQPTFDLQSERVIGIEALLRWRHPIRGVIEPADFIPIAEASGLVVPIGRWVLQEACGQAARWQARGKSLGIAVNVSARQLDTDELIDDVRQALGESGLDPSTLTLEVTETALMRDPEATAKRLHSLKDLGVRIAIDDFGTGYSSLVYLRQFPADALKIDRSFIDSIATSAQGMALIQTLVQLGKTLGIETLAEGIEDQAQLETLQRERCDHGQGFLLSRPLSAEAVEAFLDIGDVPLQAQPTS